MSFSTSTNPLRPHNDKLLELHTQFIDELHFYEGLSSATISSHRQVFSRLYRLTPGLELESLSHTTMRRFFTLLSRNTRLEHGQVRQGVRRSTIATYRARLKRFFDWLVTNGHLAANPLDGFRSPHVTYEDRKYLEANDLRRILAAVTTCTGWSSPFIAARNTAMLVLLIYTGLRRGELLGLNIDDVDVPGAQLTVRANTSKSKRKRILPLHTHALRHLEPYMKERKKRGLGTVALFIGENDERSTPSTLKHMLRRIHEVSDVRFHVHQLRHTFAVNLLQQGTDLESVRQLLGHTDIRMTSLYLRCLSPKALRTHINKLDVSDFV